MESEATFGIKETCQLNGSKRDDLRNAKALNALTKDNDSMRMDSSRKKDQNGHLYPLTCLDGDSDFSSGSPSKSPLSESITKDSDPEDLVQKGEAETFIVSTLPTQEFRTRCVLNLFLDSLDIEENKSITRKEIPSRKSVSQRIVESSAGSEANDDVQARNRSYSDAMTENVKRQPMHKQKNAVVERNSSTVQIQFTCNDQDSEDNDSQVIETLCTKHEHVKSGNESVITLIQHDGGESSFSAYGVVPFPGSIACSGSLSLRSDYSATSAKSFTFPVLQSEWNSSPVRMAKADKRHFRKHGFWTSGFLCCRFWMVYHHKYFIEPVCKINNPYATSISLLTFFA